MQIGIVGGTGKEGRGLAARWVSAGHSVTLGSRELARAEDAARTLSISGGAVRGGTNVDACAAEVIVLSVPYSAHAETVRSLKHALAGKVLVDITVPLRPPQVRRVHLPAGRSAALESQRILGAATTVVAALHHVGSIHLADLSHSIDCDVLVCSDDEAARGTVIELVKDLGMRGLDAGPLDNAVALESLTPVLLHLNKKYGGSGAGVRFTGLP